MRGPLNLKPFTLLPVSSLTAKAAAEAPAAFLRSLSSVFVEKEATTSEARRASRAKETRFSHLVPSLEEAIFEERSSKRRRKKRGENGVLGLLL